MSNARAPRAACSARKFRGVWFEKSSWRAAVYIGGRTQHVPGRFITAMEAAEAHDCHSKSLGKTNTLNFDGATASAGRAISPSCVSPAPKRPDPARKRAESPRRPSSAEADEEDDAREWKRALKTHRTFERIEASDLVAAPSSERRCRSSKGSEQQFGDVVVLRLDRDLAESADSGCGIEGCSICCLRPQDTSAPAAAVATPTYRLLAEADEDGEAKQITELFRQSFRAGHLRSPQQQLPQQLPVQLLDPPSPHARDKCEHCKRGHRSEYYCRVRFRIANATHCHSLTTADQANVTHVLQVTQGHTGPAWTALTSPSEARPAAAPRASPADKKRPQSAPVAELQPIGALVDVDTDGLRQPARVTRYVSACS